MSLSAFRRRLWTGAGLVRVAAAAAAALILTACAPGRPCPETPLVFSHQPSDYHGPGVFSLSCPTDGRPIRCYSYHRHWVCKKGTTLYWDRNLESAAREACGCPLPRGTLPASPAVSDNPDERLF